MIPDMHFGAVGLQTRVARTEAFSNQQPIRLRRVGVRVCHKKHSKKSPKFGTVPV